MNQQHKPGLPAAQVGEPLEFWGNSPPGPCFLLQLRRPETAATTRAAASVPPAESDATRQPRRTPRKLINNWDTLGMRATLSWGINQNGRLLRMPPTPQRHPPAVLVPAYTIGQTFSE